MFYSLMLTLTAMIWGGGFVAQSEGGAAMGSWTFNGVRNLIAAAVLMLLMPVFRRFKLSSPPDSPEKKKQLIKGGAICGAALFVASSLQQVGINLGDSAGKAGFLTACYIVMVPICGTFLGKKCGWNVWISALITLGGLFLLCVNGSFVLTLSDILLLLCAFAFTVQILAIDHFSMMDSVWMSCIQFLTVGVLSLPFILFGEIVPGPAAWAASFAADGAMVSLLYAALLSSCVAYTLQMVCQPKLNPAVASLIMSLESVFAVLAGWLVLGQTLTPREFAGCGLIFAAVILAQLPLGKKRQNA